MDVGLVMKIVGLVVENAGAVPELVALIKEVEGDLQGHQDNGSVPTQAYVDDLVARAKSISTQLGD